MFKQGNDTWQWIPQAQPVVGSNPRFLRWRKRWISLSKARPSQFKSPIIGGKWEEPEGGPIGGRPLPALEEEVVQLPGAPDRLLRHRLHQPSVPVWEEGRRRAETARAECVEWAVALRRTSSSESPESGCSPARPTISHSVTPNAHASLFGEKSP